MSGRPLAGAWFEIELPMRSKNSYAIPIGPADETGQLVVSGSRLRELIHEINHLFPTDYAGLDRWNGELRVRPVNRPALERLHGACDL